MSRTHIVISACAALVFAVAALFVVSHSGNDRSLSPITMAVADDGLTPAQATQDLGWFFVWEGQTYHVTAIHPMSDEKGVYRVEFEATDPHMPPRPNKPCCNPNDNLRSGPGYAVFSKRLDGSWTVREFHFFWRNQYDFKPPVVKSS